MAEPIKVLMLGWEFPPHISGGLGTACEGLSRALQQRNIDITMVLPRIPQAGLSGISFLRAEDIAPLSDDECSNKHDYYRGFTDLIDVEACINPYFSEDEYQFQKARVLAMSPEQQSREYNFGSTRLHGGYADDLCAEVGRYARTGTRLGLRGGFDIVYAHDWMTMLAGVEASHQSGAPLVLHIHSTEYDRNPQNPNRHILEIETYALQRADVIVAVSNRSKDILVNKYGIAQEMIRVVHNALTQKTPLPRTEGRFREKVILFMGRITEQKGPEYFIQAAKKVLQKTTGVRFVMAGCGDQLPRMIELVAAERMERHFHFTGFLRGDEVGKMFSLCDVFVMPSVSEPFGITPLEAMRYGIPTIISKQSGVSEIIHNVLKVDFWDIDTIASSITNALEENTLGSRGAAEVELLNWDVPAQKVETIFGDIL